MDKTDAPGPPSLPAAPEASPALREEGPLGRRLGAGGGGSQSRIPPLLLWVLAAAILLRIVTAVFHRGTPDSGEGLVRWHPLERAAAASRQSGKPVLYDFTAAWCPPCHRLDADAWTDARIAATLNDAFLPARVVDRQREDGKNPPDIEELQHRYSVTALPTLVVADASGHEISRMEGYPGKEALVAFLEEAKKKAGK
jgi:thiol:disulfide interchange protein